MHKYIILGGGGIGEALASLLHERGNEVLVISRSAVKKFIGVKYHCIDLTKPEAVGELKDCLTQFQPTHIINTIGVLHDSNHQPEKSITRLGVDWLNESINVNVMPTVYLVQALQSILNRRYCLKLLVLSARVSSISDNRLGGWYSYRMSKACLNMLIKNISIEWHRQYPKSMIVGYHPGTVDTSLSKPFQSNVPKEKLFSPQTASEYLLEVFAKLDLTDSGKLYDWQGQLIPS